MGRRKKDKIDMSAWLRTRHSAEKKEEWWMVRHTTQTFSLSYSACSIEMLSCKATAVLKDAHSHAECWNCGMYAPLSLRHNE